MIAMQPLVRECPQRRIGNGAKDTMTRRTDRERAAPGASLSREIHILWAGRRERDSWELLCRDYRGRIARFLPIKEQIVRVPMVKNDRKRQMLEGEALLAAIASPGWVIALDRRGRQLSSEKFAERLAAIREQWPHPVIFVLGSDLGLDDRLLESARERLSLGRMTLPHNLARLTLYEQIYRALSIGVGTRYHREPL